PGEPAVPAFIPVLKSSSKPTRTGLPFARASSALGPYRGSTSLSPRYFSAASSNRRATRVSSSSWPRAWLDDAGHNKTPASRTRTRFGKRFMRSLLGSGSSPGPFWPAVRLTNPCAGFGLVRPHGDRSASYEIGESRRKEDDSPDRNLRTNHR